ncbi:hypothetical protein EV702DRAFT_968902, partial [Suillus placidus]
CPPHLQAAFKLGLQSDVLHAEDKDYTTAYSYFYKTFEKMSSQTAALKHMLSFGVMLNMLREIESMRAIALLHQKFRIGTWWILQRPCGITDMACYDNSLTCHCYTELSSNPTIRSHLAALYDTLFQQDLMRIVEPYSVVEVDHVAKHVGQGRQDLMSYFRLSQMILDKVFHGVLEEETATLSINGRHVPAH